AVVEVRTSTWSTDPYARGAYSFHALGSGPDNRLRLQEPVSDRLYLAGEAVGVNNPSTVTGALASGRNAADQLMHRLPRVQYFSSAATPRQLGHVVSQIRRI